VSRRGVSFMLCILFWHHTPNSGRNSCIRMRDCPHFYWLSVRLRYSVLFPILLIRVRSDKFGNQRLTVVIQSPQSLWI